MRRLDPLYFVCGGFYRELVLYFLGRLLGHLVFLHELVGQAVGCGPRQFFNILFAAVFSPQHRSVHAGSIRRNLLGLVN